MDQNTFDNIAGIAVAVILIGFLFIVLPLLIVWLKDRRGLLGGIIRISFGLVALLFGVLMIGWIGYIIVWGSPVEELNWIDYLRAPFAGLMFAGMACYGWYWLTGSGPGIEAVPLKPAEPEYAWALAEAQARIAEFAAAIRATGRKSCLMLVPAPLEILDEQEKVDSRAYPDEYSMWVEASAFNNGVFEFLLPPEDPGEHPSTPFTVHQHEIRDWHITDRESGKITGGFELLARFLYMERKKRHINRYQRRQRELMLDWPRYAQEGGRRI